MAVFVGGFGLIMGIICVISLIACAVMGKLTPMLFAGFSIWIVGGVALMGIASLLDNTEK